MENIEFWVYIIFAVIYFLARGLRKKSKPKPVARPQSPLETDDGDTRQPPVSFEDLLEEITGRKTLEKTEEIIEPAEPEEKPAGPPEETPKFEEGKTRRFSDEESKRVYEESIRQAEGFEIDYGTADPYQSKKVTRETAELEEENKLAEEVRAMLQDTDSARKAIILSEIIGRKY